jgi:hypothetical protein
MATTASADSPALNSAFPPKEKTASRWRPVRRIEFFLISCRLIGNRRVCHRCVWVGVCVFRSGVFLLDRLIIVLRQAALMQAENKTAY